MDALSHNPTCLRGLGVGGCPGSGLGPELGQDGREASPSPRPPVKGAGWMGPLSSGGLRGALAILIS